MAIFAAIGRLTILKIFHNCVERAPIVVVVTGLPVTFKSIKIRHKGNVCMGDSLEFRLQKNLLLCFLGCDFWEK